MTSLPSTFYRPLGKDGTQQRKVIVTVLGKGDGVCAECHRVSTVLTLGKEAPRGPFYQVLSRAY
jgi:hypothetical protein